MKVCVEKRRLGNNDNDIRINSILVFRVVVYETLMRLEFFRNIFKNALCGQGKY